MAGAWVQDDTTVAQDGGSGVELTSKAFGANVTAGNLIAVMFGFGLSGTPTCSDGLGNTYTLKTNTYDATNEQSHAQFYAKNITGGACTVTADANSGSAGYLRLGIMEISGCDTTAPDDGGAAAVQAGGTATDHYSSGNIITTVTDFVFGSTQNIAEASPGTGTLTAGATPAYTIRETAGANVIGMETRASQAAATFDANFTRSVGHRSITGIMAFKETAGGASVRKDLLLLGVGQ